MEQNHLLTDAQFSFDEGTSAKQKWHPISTQKSIEENDYGSYDCNICLDSANEPVVTLCGHLYCWPCIYKWLHVVSEEEYQQEKCCPVCKSNISTKSLVPLYGPGKSPSNIDAKKTNLNQGIPRRPAPAGVGTSITSTPQPAMHPSQHFNANYFQPAPHPIYNQQYYPDLYGGPTASLASNLGGTTMASFTNPATGMFGEMVYARIFGSSEDSRTLAYPYQFALIGNTSNPRVRRQEMKMEKSLNRVSVFLFFCIILCLILF